ncbi:MAG TPA: NrfD/PsrC family molybdoenzyme membrane anchor subunit, partial [Tepidisphaeraceae bacterium]|nr:NrfD/PsrC family molybdoenzyme membrane anchor subunit [Tepidisphaeraceae bacterium]
LGATGALLVADLKQPKRFLYVLMRPQWKSWLVRGAYFVTVFGAFLPVVWLLSVFGAPRDVQLAFGGVITALGLAVAGYTALLFAQARGRDYWQNPLLVVTMIIDALVAGIAVCVMLGLFGLPASLPGAFGLVRSVLLISTIVLIVIQLAEMLSRHQTKNAEIAARAITRGPYAAWFWIGCVLLGLIAPLVLIGADKELQFAVPLLLMVGIIAKNHVLVQAPQRVPLS